MNPWAILGWTGDADVHCTACAKRLYGPCRKGKDRIDREGNDVLPVFVQDVDSSFPEGMYCGDCGRQLSGGLDGR